MKLFHLGAAAMILAALTGPGVAQQSSDDTKWIKQCVTDNKDEGPAADVILAYCTCMNGKMSDNETQSITQWEKSHPREREACSRQAGWK